MALSANQRMVCNGGVTFWAWIISVVLHLMVLSGLGFVRFSYSEAVTKQGPVPAVKISRIKKLVQAINVIPKPKVKRPVKRSFVRESDGLLPANQIFNTVEKSVSKDWPDLAKHPVSTSEISLSGGSGLWEGIEFFGSFAEERKVCYVVDCSGSMQGIFSRVQEKLSESIRKHQPDQYFYIIFFGGGRLFEFGEGKLLRATEETKSAAYKFIDSVQPTGRTNAPAALERALQICSGVVGSPAVVYFLTDGFELAAEDEQGFSQNIAELLAKFAPGTRINTIGFWPQSGDREMLRAIARQSGGDFVLVEDY